ncbi:MAG: TylF/MycF family methyltransferase [Ignavibacteria bacterium]|jgi:hypothetical protein|nr:TylF/MycF family methyltransferase [Ignavibacteria bacterium]
MKSKFGILAAMTFAQDMVSSIIANVNPAIIHAVGKYVALSKIFYYSALENVEGDYLEFGVYAGSSLSHAIKCYNKSLMYCHPPQHSQELCRFFGFDSFEGFGELEDEDNHPFFIHSNFATDIEKVRRRLKPRTKKFDVKLVKGFFCDSLKCGASAMGITAAKVVMIDSDTYVAAVDVFKFITPIVQPGTIIVLDDELCYKASKNLGETRAFNDWLNETGITVSKWFTYGDGAFVYVVSSVPNK